jgi:hypothetical protein
MAAGNVVRMYRLQPVSDPPLEVIADFPQHGELCGRFV